MQIGQIYYSGEINEKLETFDKDLPFVGFVSAVF